MKIPLPVLLSVAKWVNKDLDGKPVWIGTEVGNDTCMTEASGMNKQARSRWPQSFTVKSHIGSHDRWRKMWVKEGVRECEADFRTGVPSSESYSGTKLQTNVALLLWWFQPFLEKSVFMVVFLVLNSPWESFLIHQFIYTERSNRINSAERIPSSKILSLKSLLYSFSMCISHNYYLPGPSLSAWDILVNR